ncbi:MAG: hypothetical protein NC212_08180 [Staphylococcus sp.]|nr:hypothetical protein [Staphylococcus sp.]
MDAFAKVQPRYIITVPLIIEKIIRTRIFPMLEKPLMKLMLMVPYVDERTFSRHGPALSIRDATAFEIRIHHFHDLFGKIMTAHDSCRIANVLSQ